MCFYNGDDMVDVGLGLGFVNNLNVFGDALRPQLLIVLLFLQVRHLVDRQTHDLVLNKFK
jgi:hypothetical protein